MASTSTTRVPLSGSFKHLGSGEPALKTLAAYLYRGVISEQNIVANHHGQVTFEYREARTGSTRTRTLNGDEFWWLILQHVLPKGFRRVRDDGFLHGNAKARLTLVQWVLRVGVRCRFRAYSLGAFR